MKNELSKSKKFRGIRIRPKTEIDISSQDFIDKMGELAKRNLVLELRENYKPIEAIEQILRTYPNMNIIMNHGHQAGLHLPRPDIIKKIQS